MLMTTFAECRAGHHHACPRVYPDPGIGGASCDCECHSSRATGRFRADPVARPDPRTTGELEEWLAISHRADPAIFESFLRHFPDGDFADDARERLARLKG